MAAPVAVGRVNPTPAECVPDFCDRCEDVMFVSERASALIRDGMRALCEVCFAVENTKPKR